MARSSVVTLFFLVCLLLWLSPRTAHAAQSYDNCTGFVTSVPAVINTQGTWCLKQDLATAVSSGVAITIATNNVTLDCNDFKLGGLAAGAGTATVGIKSFDRVNATIRHCNVRGFYIGIYLGGTSNTSSGGHLVEDNRLDGNTSLGIGVRGDGSVIRNNRVFDTGGATLGNDANGIGSNGSIDIVDNIISGVAAVVGSNGWAIGINAASDDGGSIDRNRVRGLALDGSGLELGITTTGTHIALQGNELVGTGSSGTGVDCVDSGSAAKDNLINDFGGAISNCTDGGGNVVLP